MSSRKVKFKKGIFQKMFWFISILFILSVIIVFLIKYIAAGKNFNDDKKIYEYVIEKNNVVKVDDFYYFKGEDVNNYLKYGNLLFRIVKVYKDGSMDIITDKSINSLYNKNDDVLKYVREFFYKSIDHDLLNTSPYCKDIIDDVKNITCNDIDFSSYVKLLSVTDYVNSLNSKKTYLSDMWLGTKNKDGYWIINDGNLAKGNDNMVNDVYPVITLKNSVKYTSGDGSSEKPFEVKSESKLGSYVKIMDDTYIVTEVNGHNLKLTLTGDKILVRKMFNKDVINRVWKSVI